MNATAQAHAEPTFAPLPGQSLPTTPNAYQSGVLRYRKHCNIAQLGGRGSSKTTCMIFDILAHVTELGPAASVLVTRESWSGLQELSFRLYQLGRIAFGAGVSQNKGAGTLSFPSGAMVYFKNLADADSFASAQGRTYTMLAHDEAGNYPISAVNFMTLLRSNLRPPIGIRPHIHITANPMGRAHVHFLRNFVHKAAPNTPYQDEFGHWWINVYSDLTDNPAIDQDTYRRQLQAATAGNPALAAAWISNDWHQKGGGLMFGDVFDPRVHIADIPTMHRVRFKVGVDIGTRSPSVAVLLGELLDPVRSYIPGDLFAVDMTDTCIEPGNYHEGNGIPISGFAAQVKTLLNTYGLPLATPVIVDDMRGLHGVGDTAVSIFSEQGLRGAEKVREKNRAGNWIKIRNLLDGAVNGDSHGVWFSPRCGHLIDTISIAPRDDLRSEDLSRHFNEDHAIDAFALGVQALTGGPKGGNGKTVIGYW